MTRQNMQWVMKDHTAVKHKVLSEYLERWLAILGRPDDSGEPRTLHYIDTHAGRGRYDGGEVGSPIIAMQKGEELHQHHKGTVYLDCHDIEADSANFASLEHEITQARSQYPSVDVSVYEGDFREHMPEILRRVPTDQAALIFIDPFGYSDVALRQILEYLRGRRYHELFVTFMSQYISRFMSDESKHGTLDMVLSTTEWRSLIGVRDSEEKIVNLYAKRLQQTGSELTKRRMFSYPIKLQVPNGRSPYYLIHVSQHPKGRLAMEVAVDAASNSRSLSSEALQLFTTVEIEQTIIDSVNRRPGISAIEIAGSIWENNLSATWRNDIRRTIQRLSQDGVFTIRDKRDALRNVGVLPAESDKIFATGRQPSETPLF